MEQPIVRNCHNEQPGLPPARSSSPPPLPPTNNGSPRLGNLHVDRWKPSADSEVLLVDKKENGTDDEEQSIHDLEVSYKDLCYDIMFQILLHTKAKLVNNFHSRHKDKNITKTLQYNLLDIGCGTGVLWEYLIDAFKELMIDTCQSKQDGLEGTETSSDDGNGTNRDVHVADTASAVMTTTVYELHITGVDDLSSSQKIYNLTKEHSEEVETQYTHYGYRDSNGGHHLLIIKPIIHVVKSDIIEYCNMSRHVKNEDSLAFDGIIMNTECYGDFIHPNDVLRVLPTRMDSVILLHEHNPATISPNVIESVEDIINNDTSRHDEKTPSPFEVLSLTKKPYYLLTMRRKKITK